MEVAKNMSEDINTIAQVVFMTIVLSTAWSIEDNETSMIDRNCNICKELIKHI